MSYIAMEKLRDLNRQFIFDLPVSYGCRISDKIICRIGDKLRPDVPGDHFILLAEKTEVDGSLFLAAFPNEDLRLESFGGAVRKLLIIDSQE